MSETKYIHSQATCKILILHQVLQIHVKCKHIVGNFWGRKLLQRKLLQISEKYDFTEKTLADCSLLLCQRMPCPQISWRKFLQRANKPQNLGKFSLSKVFYYTVISGEGGGTMYGTYSCTPDMMLADTPSSPRYSEMEWFFTRYSCATFPIAYSTAPPRQNRSPLSWSEAEMWHQLLNM